MVPLQKKTHTMNRVFQITDYIYTVKPADVHFIFFQTETKRYMLRIYGMYQLFYEQ
jgi:hypothetical protein